MYCTDADKYQSHVSQYTMSPLRISCKERINTADISNALHRH